ncbi:hypothetical protein R6Q57_017747 [Mikania cordata]
MNKQRDCFVDLFVFKEWMLKQKRVDPSIQLTAFEKCIYQAIGRKHILVDYLGKWKHPMTKELKKATIVTLELKWATIGNITDCGVFAMRHMEMVRSNCHTPFNCGFSTSQE